MALVMVCYINSWLKPMNFIMIYIGKFLVSFLPYITLLILLATLISALFINMIFGLHLKGTSSYLQSFLTSWLMLTRGPLVYIATFEYLEEGLEYISERVDIILLVFIVTVFHFLLKYFLINL